ncbi:MAG: TetR/AcrR family transcriptional regulator [Bacteroidota bacterium]
MSKAAQTKSFIIEKIAPVFNKKGYAGTSLTDITEATGLTKGSIYGNFANKDEVAVAAFDFNLETVNTILKNEISKESAARNKLKVYVKVYENFGKYSFPEGGCPVLNTSIEADDTHPLLKQRACDAVMSWKKSISDIVKTGIAGKEFSKNTDAEQIAITIIAMLEGSIMIAGATGKTQYRNAVMKSLGKMIDSL